MVSNTSGTQFNEGGTPSLRPADFEPLRGDAEPLRDARCIQQLVVGPFVCRFYQLDGAAIIALEHGVPTERIAEAERLALHAGAFSGIPDAVFHFTARAMGVVTGLAATEPDPAAPQRDVILDAALRAATGLAKLLGFRSDCVTATTAADQA